MTSTAPTETSAATWRTRLAEELRPDRLIPSLVAGLLVSVIVVIVSVSLATLIFSGELDAYLADGIGMMLFSGVLITGIVAIASSYPGMVAYPQERVAPILALMAATIVGRMAGAPSEHVFLTVAAAILAASLATGLFLWAVGFFRLGVLIRFIPYPVIGGFLAGTGYLLVKGSLGVMMAMHLHLGDLPRLLEPALAMKWAPGVLFGAAMVLVTHRFKHYLVMPALLLGGVAVFYLTMAALGATPDAARADGWLLGPFPEAGPWRPVTLQALAAADRVAVLGELANLLTILFIAVVSVLLNSGALELIVKRDIDLNRELKVAGAANVLIGLGGGTVGFHSLAISRLVHGMGANSRLVGLTASAVCAGMLAFGSAVLTFFPRVILGGLLFYLGMHFLVEWVYEAWFRLTRSDYAIVLTILGCVAFFGYLYGVGVGIIACIVMFLVNYSGVNVVKRAMSGAHRRSNVDRPRRHLRLLAERGNQIQAFELQGYIFFGTANGLLNQVRARVEATPAAALRYLVIDFRGVSGIDSSSTISFVKMRQLAEQKQFVLIFTQVSGEIAAQLAMAGLDGEPSGSYHRFRDADHALEWCEDRILADAGMDVDEYDRITLADQLREELPPEVDADRLLGYFERRTFEAGACLIRQGDPPSDLYFIERGQVTASLELQDGTRVRLRKMQAGAIVGEIGLILGQPRSATVVAKKETIVYGLSTEAMRRMAQESPGLAVAFHRYLGQLLAERLAQADDAIRTLLE